MTASRPEGAKGVEERVREWALRYYPATAMEWREQLIEYVAALCIEYAREQVEAMTRDRDLWRANAEEWARTANEDAAQLQTLRGERDDLKADVAAARMLSRDAQIKAGTLAQEKAALEAQITAMQQMTTPDHTPPPGWHSWGDKVADLEARERAAKAIITHVRISCDDDADNWLEHRERLEALLADYDTALAPRRG